MDGQLKSRFTQGEEGRRRLLGQLMEQRVVEHRHDLARLLADAADIRQHEAGDILIHQDHDGNDVAFLLMGKVEILVNDHRVGVRSAGEHVGEMAAIDPKAKRSATVRATDVTVAAWVPEAKIDEIAERFPLLWRGFARLLADRLRERGDLVRRSNPKPRIFIGSSVEGLAIAATIQKGLSHDPMVVRVWTDDVFRPSGYTMTDLVNESASSDFAVFVVRGDDTTRTRDHEAPTPRDNVILELGLFMGALGRERTLLVRPRGANLKIPSDLLGLTALDYDGNAAPDDLEAALGPVCLDIRKTVKRLGPR